MFYNIKYNKNEKSNSKSRTKELGQYYTKRPDLIRVFPFPQLTSQGLSMFSRIAFGSNMRILKQTSKISRSIKSLSHLPTQGSRSYSTGSASCSNYSFHNYI